MIRRGAALIIVLLILVALTLLGLPFLFSQTWGLAGARSMQAHQAAQIYLGTAERLGIALGIYANDGATRTTTGTDTSAQMHSALELYLGDSMPTPAGISPLDPATTRNHAVIKPQAFGLNHGPSTAISISIADESGMLDPNLLDAEGWADLFKKLEIPDWDDDDVEVIWQTGEGPDQDRIGELAQELSWYRVHTGRFARLDDLRIPTPQLSWRHTLNGNRNPHPEFRKRLNAAEVERLSPYLSFHNRGAGRRGLTDLGSIVASDKDLTVGVPASGGNPAQPPVIDTSTIPGKWFVPSRFSVDIGESILNHGTWIEAEPKPGDKPQVGLVRMNGNEQSGYNYEIDYPGGTLPERDSGLWLQAPPALNIHQMKDTLRTLPAYQWGNKIPLAPPTPATDLPDPLTTFPIRAYSQITAPAMKPDLPWLYLRPRFTPFIDDPTKTDQIGPPRERQPLDLRSDGLVRVEAAATILDAAGGQAAQRARTTVVQAVPQEGPIEHRWITQGQFEPLVGQRFTSQMTTWPKATGRAIDVEPDDVLPSAGTPPSGLTGLSFTTLAGPANYAPNSATPLSHLDLKWRAPLGNRNPGTSVNASIADYVLKDRRVVGTTTTESATNPVDTDLIPPTLTQGTNEGLYPDGVRVGPGTQFAYAFDRDGGPLRMADGNPIAPSTGTRAAPNNASLGYCHIGFWFRPEDVWVPGTITPPITLMEARQHPKIAESYRLTGDLAALDLNGTIIPRFVAGKNSSTIEQNYFGVLYDPQQNMLVATYTPPSATCVAPALPWTALVDDPDPLNRTPWQDERCLPGAAQQWLIPGRINTAACNAWSQTYRPNRIMTCWKLGNENTDHNGNGKADPNQLEKGRWYHLQLVIGNGRPGGIGIILDGIVGTDVGLMKSSDYLASRLNSKPKGPWAGDHLTIPSMLLLDDLPAVTKPVNTPALVAQLYPKKIAIEMPGFSAFANDDYTNPGVGLTPADTLQPRGTVLIGDEYIRYETLKEISGTWELGSCTRGFRQDSDSGNADFRFNYPTTETHAKGSRVLADGARVNVGGNLLLGGTETVDQVKHGTATFQNRIIGTIVSPRNDATAVPYTANVQVTGPDWAFAPDHGFIRIDESNGGKKYFFYFRATNGDLILEDPSKTWATPALVAAIPTVVGSAVPNLPWAASYSSTNADPATVTLVGIEVTDSADLTAGGMWKPPTGSRDGGVMLQLLDPTTGRCEWLCYTHIVRRLGPNLESGADVPTGWFINRTGWTYDPAGGRDRAQQRTPFVETEFFPAKTLVLPVQTSGNVDFRWCKALAPGDLVTIFPKDMSGTARPVVAAVRYSANDGYSFPSSGLNDTVNGWLALTWPLKNLIKPGIEYEMIMGTGLNSPRDLTPLDGGRIVSFPASATPRLDAHADPTDPTSSGRLVLGSEDTKRGGTAASSLVVSVDGLYAGAWTNSAGRIIRAYAAGAALTEIKAIDDLPLFIEADHPVFEQPVGNENQLMLLEIGGEVFACERLLDADKSLVIAAMDAMPATRKSFKGNLTPTAWVDANHGNFAKLVGRGLLASGAPNRYNPTATGTPFAIGPDISQLIDEQKNNFGNLDLGPEFFRLPVGPVRYLTEPDKLSTGKWFQVDDVVRNGASTMRKPSTGLNNDVLLITEPNRPAAKKPWEGVLEMMQIADRDGRQFLTAWDPNTKTSVNVVPGNKENPNYNRMVTSWWLRGLYNTPANTDWKQSQYLTGGRGDLQPLVIGWWPRYASCLPSLRATDSDPLGDLTPQHLRSRLFPWIGMAMRLHGARFEDTADEAAFALRLNAASNGCLDNQSGMRLEIRAMAGTINGREDVAGAFAGTSGIRGNWWSVTPQVPSVINDWQYVRGLYPWNPGGGPVTAAETDGVEVRMHFRYTGVTTTDLSEIARNGSRAPLIGGAKMRCYAPVSIVATDEAR